MRKIQLVTALLLIVSTFSMADTYKWLDESGGVHYGDSPPSAVSSQRVFTSEAPSEEDRERQQQQVQELIDKYQQERPLAPSVEPTQITQAHTAFPDDVACFSPLSGLVQGSSAEYHTPISPILLVKKQQSSLKTLLASIKTRGTWHGALIELECWGQSIERNGLPTKKYKSTKVEMSTDWDKSESLLTLDFEIPYGANLVYRLAIDDFLYFNELRASNITLRDDNKVELLTHQQNSAAFLIKRYIPNRQHHRFHFNHHGTRLRADIRYIEVSNRKLKLVELYYYDGELASSKTWLLSRANKT
ncbi:hypothetical protein A9Q78_08465 [Methylophaga sp. 41_12_T18]|nr:hypothetical protein A9Q78_08465 [Methylophaga sp. 41_12_T18]